MTANALTEASLLLIDDEDANLDLLEGLLVGEGYHRITRVSDARQAIREFEACSPDIVLLDLHMPFVTGYEVLEGIRQRVASDDYLPVLVLTADVTIGARDRALSRGARDFVTKPFDAVEVLLRVSNLLETRRLHQAQRAARRRAEGAERHATLLAEASRLLAVSLDSETGLAQVARLLVPGFAGSARFVVAGRENDEPRVLAAATAPDAGGHADGSDTDAAANAAHTAAHTAAEAAAIAAVLATGQPRRLTGPSGEVLVAPLRSVARVLGALVVTAPGRGGEFDEAGARTIVDLAGRAALAVENAFLFADAQMATRARERMLSVVAHDLRNPLAVIGMYAEMLVDLLPDEADVAAAEGEGEARPGRDGYAAEALNSIYRSVQRMQEQIEGLLDVTRLQEGRFMPDRSPCHAEDLFGEAEMLLRPLAASHGIMLDVCPRGDPPGEPLLVDSGRFQQLLSNLVGNAVKFSPDGGRVTIAWELVDGALRVSVEDTGPGIEREQLPHLFSAFWQARDGDRRGLGLGLWIARAIVEGHGGRIWADTAEGGGAVFHFTLPDVRASSEAGPRPETPMGSMTHDPAPTAL